MPPLPIRVLIASALFAIPAQAAEKVVALDAPGLFLDAAAGNQVTLKFSDDLKAKYFPDGTYPGLTISTVDSDKFCFYGAPDVINLDDAKYKPILGPEGADLCIARKDASVVYDDQVVQGAPPQPFFSVDAKSCKWVWKTGTGIGVWSQDCDFGDGKAGITYKADSDAFVMGTTPDDTYPVIQQFHKKADEQPDVLLAEFRKKGLIPDDNECKFAPLDDVKLPEHWKALEITPTGKRKQAFDALPDDEVPDPPCGDLGMAVDYVAYFMVDDRHPDRLVYVNLGQDSPLFDPSSITLF